MNRKGPSPKAKKATRLEVRNLSISLDGRTILDKVTITVAPHEIVGILGPNGSGKTSLLRCITGLWLPDSGSLTLDGKKLDRRNPMTRASMGIVFQDPSLDEKLKARENLVLVARLFGIGRKDAGRRADELLAFMELADCKDRRVDTFSGGMKRRLELARALINEPRLLVLDEPTNGLDPIAFDRTWKRLHTLRETRGLTMLISTHRADEAAFCDRLVIFDRGRVVTTDRPKDLLDRLAGDIIVLETTRAEEVAATLGDRFDVTPRIDGDKVFIRTENGHELVPRFVEAFPPGLFRAISLRKPSLADAFLQIVGHSLDEEQGEGET